MVVARVIFLTRSSLFFWAQSLLRYDRRIGNTFCMKGKPTLMTTISCPEHFSFSIFILFLPFSHLMLFLYPFSAGSSVMAAYVEIVFDNSDGKLQ
jgi:hypothetical protein